MNRSTAYFALALALAAPACHAAYRCDAEGRVVYQELPCGTGGGTWVDLDPMQPTPEEAERARQRMER